MLIAEKNLKFISIIISVEIVARERRRKRRWGTGEEREVAGGRRPTAGNIGWASAKAR